MAIDKAELDWRRAAFGDGSVEVAMAGDGSVGVRDSRDPDGPVLTFTPLEWDAFVGGVKDGEFDLGETPGQPSGLPVQ